ncbi:unnamed protein product [Brachionus calyciflorus]|uniref:DNA-directed DNA polymerase n=1 Tax=Brachionus calyciflorus TaxID=104777 RepID=A0A814LX83_9BILA|nr:unnamed protein product [Brachionus calyciflorus]
MCSENEEIGYDDITTLYPFVQKYCNYPIAYPILVTENFDDVRKYFGMIKCKKVLPPRELYFPVLPSRINGKLVFPVCRTCAEVQQSQCNHSIEEKCLEGTWVTLEIQEALRQGYQIVEIYEVWNWEKLGLLFGDYVDMFLKGKQEADGYPDNLKSEVEKQQYIKYYYEREGVLLDAKKIDKNKGLRSVMKMLLNSFWGRFGMNTNKTQYKVISNPLEWFEMVSDDQYTIHNADFSHENYVQVFYSTNVEMHEGSSQTSVVLAAFVTCHARLKLYEE